MNKFLLKQLDLRRAIIDDDFETYKSIFDSFDGDNVELLFLSSADILKTANCKYYLYIFGNCKLSNKTMNELTSTTIKEMNKSEKNLNIALDYLVLNPYLSDYNRDRLIRNIDLSKYPQCKDKVQKVYDKMIPNDKYHISLSMYNYGIKNGITINPLQLSKNKNTQTDIFEKYKGDELNWYYLSEHRLNREFLIKYREFVIFEIFIISNNTPEDYLSIEEYIAAYNKVELYKNKSQEHCLLNEIYCQSTGDNPITTKWGVSDYYIDANCAYMSKEDLEFILKYYLLGNSRKVKLQTILDTKFKSSETE